MSELHSDDLKEHTLSSVSNLPSDWVAALTARWITTAEQVLAMSSTPEGRRALEVSLPANTMTIEQVLLRLTEIVGPERAAQLQQPADRGGALGAKLTDEQKRQFGIE